MTRGCCTSGNLDISTQMASDADEGAIWISFYFVFLIPPSWVPQLSEGVRLIAGLMRDKAAVLGTVSKERVDIRCTLIETGANLPSAFSTNPHRTFTCERLPSEYSTNVSFWRVVNGIR
jgi:hypothetical protein